MDRTELEKMSIAQLLRLLAKTRKLPHDNMGKAMKAFGEALHELIVGYEPGNTKELLMIRDVVLIKIQSPLIWGMADH
ncbi:MAG: hypothetical protein Q7S10_03985 [bacterium]|nr:hypothetical protein [bacterium]